MIMKAIVVNGPGDMQLVERPMPEIKEPNQVLVKVHAAGICGSDVHVYHGSNPYAKYPVVLGHEGSGEVIAVGEGVTDLKPGASVVFEPITYCGKCYACRCGHHNVCRELRFWAASWTAFFRNMWSCRAARCMSTMLPR